MSRYNFTLPDPVIVSDESLLELTFRGHSSAADALQARLDGNDDPAVPINRRFPSTGQVEVRCPHCGICHRHGEVPGHRISHCRDSAGAYWILALKPKELEQALRVDRRDRPVVIEL